MRRRFQPNVASAASRRPALSGDSSKEPEQETVSAVVIPEKTVGASPLTVSSQGEPSSLAGGTTLVSTSTGESGREECAEPVGNRTSGLIGRRRPAPNLAASRGRRRTSSITKNVSATNSECHEPPAKRVCSADTDAESGVGCVAPSSSNSDAGQECVCESGRDKESSEPPKVNDAIVCDRSERQAPVEPPSKPPEESHQSAVQTQASSERRSIRQRSSDSRSDGDREAAARESRTTSRGRGRKQKAPDSSASSSSTGDGASSGPSDGCPVNDASTTDKQTPNNTAERNLQKGKRKVRSRQMTGPPEPTTMTMRDLIHRNPTANKMSYNDKTKLLTPDAADKSAMPSANSSSSTNGTTPPSGSSTKDSTNDSMVMAPQVRITADGQVVLDESSLTIRTTDAIRDEQQEKEVVYESANTATYASFSKRTSIDRWSEKDTAKFYGALQQVGTDFSLMAPLFPKRTRRQLKNKFKKEERFSPGKVAQALRDIKPIDPDLFFRQKEDDLEADTVVSAPCDGNGSDTNSTSGDQVTDLSTEPVQGSQIEIETPKGTPLAETNATL